MQTVLALTMEWTIHYTDGDTWVQDNLYQFDVDILNHKREKIIKECVELYGDNIDYIEFKLLDEGDVVRDLEPYRHKVGRM